MRKYDPPVEKIFGKFRKSDHAKLTEEEYQTLFVYGLILPNTPDWYADESEGPEVKEYTISDKGREYRYDKKRVLDDAVRYWITTVIAIVALFVAILSIILQYA